LRLWGGLRQKLYASGAQTGAHPRPFLDKNAGLNFIDQILTATANSLPEVLAAMLTI